MNAYENLVQFLKVMREYFVHYGGWKSILCSPFFLISLASTAASYSYWINGSWPEMAKAMIPNLLGFSLGTYALLSTIMTNNVRKALTELNEGDSTYLEVINATFLHFIVVQVICLFWSILFSGTLFVDIFSIFIGDNYAIKLVFGSVYIVGSFAGCFLLFYSISLILASAIAVFNIANIHDNN